HHRPCRGAVRRELVNAVEGRAELAEQATLRHAPPPGEIGRGHAVEGQPRHTAYPIVSTPPIQLYGANAYKRPRWTSATINRIDQIPPATASTKLTTSGSGPTAATLT